MNYKGFLIRTTRQGKGYHIAGHRGLWFKTLTSAKRWIGRREALNEGRGKRVKKIKPRKTKGIRIKHTCCKISNKTFARFRFSTTRDSITLINPSSQRDGFEDIIVDCSDKTTDWFESLPEVYTCSSCSFTITKTEIMNSYFFKKMKEPA